MRMREISMPKETVEIRFGTRSGFQNQVKRNFDEDRHKLAGEILDSNSLILDEELDEVDEHDDEAHNPLDDIDSIDGI